MKLSVSLSEADVAVLDEYMRNAGLTSRSAALQHAVKLLRHPRLERDYADAWQEWADAGDDDVWNSAIEDGLPRAQR